MGGTRISMLNPIFKKEKFKKSVREEVKNLFRTTLEEANSHQIYQAVCYVVKDVIIDNWMKTQKVRMRQILKSYIICAMDFEPAVIWAIIC